MHAPVVQVLPVEAYHAQVRFSLPPCIVPILSGCAFAFSLVAIGHPFDTVKTRMQLRIDASLLGCLRNLQRSDGLFALYRGASMPLCTLICKQPFEFAIFEKFNERFPEVTGRSFLGGGLAGVVGAVIGTPFSIVKVEMQSTGRAVHANSLRAFNAVLGSISRSGYQNSLKASLLFQMPFSATLLGTYGLLRDELLPRGPHTTALAGGAASLFTWTALLPLDILRTQIQANAVRRSPHGPAQGTALSVHRVLFNLIQTRGLAGLWAGWVPVALKAVPTNSVSMFAYEWARSFAEGLVD